MKKLLSLISLALSAGLIALGCTASQLARADRAVGGTPLVPTTQLSPDGTVKTIPPTTQQLEIHLAQDATKAAQPVVQEWVPAPWGGIVSAGLGILSGVLGVIAVKQTSKAAAVSNVITAAAPGVAQLVKQTTDNQVLADDITHVAQLAPGVINLLNHPAAKATGATIPQARLTDV